jgi:molybdenum cofactor synthesis domain-containing protein
MSTSRAQTRNPTAMAQDRTVTACLLIIGNEILSGRTQDKNLAHIAKGLNEVGVQLREVRVIPDVRETIVATVNECRKRFDYLFTTGGIGPTHDDITSDCVAEAFGVPMVRDEAVVALMASYLKGRGEMNEARLRMATFPKGYELLPNAISAAPGYRLDNVFVMAGVPHIMQAMFETAKKQLRGGKTVLSRSVAVGLGEGTIAQGLAVLQARYRDVDIGSYPQMRADGFRVSLVMRGTDAALLDRVVADLIQMLRDLGGSPVEEPVDAPAGEAA